MTQTTTATQPHPEAAPDPNRPVDSRSLLLNLIVALLAPMFLGVTAGDVALARMAAAETVNAYRSRDHADLVAVAQIVAFGLAALGSLSLSMADEISLSMTLRLRSNANALNRSAEQNRRATKEIRPDSPAPHQATAAPEIPAIPEDSAPQDTEPFLSEEAANMLATDAQARLHDGQQAPVHTADPAPCPTMADPISDKRHQQMWAIAMVKEAGDIIASIPNLPPEERNAASLQAAALSSTAHQLLTGTPAPVVHDGGPAMRPDTP